MKKSLLTAMMMACVVCSAGAQMNGMTMPATKLGDHETPAQAEDDLIAMFESVATAAAKAMPAEKYDFTPASLNIAGANYDGVRTFSDEVKHLAQANYFFASMLSGAAPDPAMRGVGALKSKDDIVAALTASFAAMHKAAQTLTATNISEVVKFEGGTGTRGTVGAFAVAHGFDHYGQMVEYLRMNGITPPASAK